MSHHHVQSLNSKSDLLEFAFSHCVVNSTGKNVILQSTLIKYLQSLKSFELFIELRTSQSAA